jgi:hypothetical protein
VYCQEEEEIVKQVLKLNRYRLEYK